MKHGKVQWEFVDLASADYFKEFLPFAERNLFAVDTQIPEIHSTRNTLWVYRKKSNFLCVLLSRLDEMERLWI